jgi:hypothetical protein
VAGRSYFRRRSYSEWAPIPKPDHVIVVANSYGAVVEINPRRPITSHLFEMQRRVKRIRTQLGETLSAFALIDEGSFA